MVVVGSMTEDAEACWIAKASSVYEPGDRATGRARAAGLMPMSKKGGAGEVN